MADGTVTSITENGLTLIVTVNINGADYILTMSKVEFDALPTNLVKHNYVIAALSNSRKVSRQHENIYPAIIGTVLNIPD